MPTTQAEQALLLASLSSGNKIPFYYDIGHYVETPNVFWRYLILPSDITLADKSELLALADLNCSSCVSLPVVVLSSSLQSNTYGLGGSATWGAIGGAISAQTDLITRIDQFPVDIQRFGFVRTLAGDLGVTPSFNGSNTFTLVDTGSGWAYYRSGIKYSQTGNRTLVLAGTPVTAGTYYIVIDDALGTLSAVSSFDPTSTQVFVAILLFNDALTPKYLISFEAHSCLFDRMLHWYLHSTQGTQLKTLGTLDAPTINGSADSQNTFGMGDCVIVDEDFDHTLTGFAKPNGATNDYPLFYRTAPSTWAWKYSDVPFSFSATYIQWDNNGTLTTGINGRYYNSYLMLTTLGGAAFCMLSGRGEFANLAAAQAEDVTQFNFAGLGIAENVIVYQFSWEARTSLGTKGKVRLAAAPKRVQVSSVTTISPSTVPAANVLFSPASTDLLSTNAQAAISELANWNRIFQLCFNIAAWTVTGSGLGVAASANNVVSTSLGTGVGTIKVRFGQSALLQLGSNAHSWRINWTRSVYMRGRFSIAAISDNNAANRICAFLGKAYNDTALGELAVRGIGLQVENFEVKFVTHDGTTLAKTAALITLENTASLAQVLDFVAMTNGDGNLYAKVRVTGGTGQTDWVSVVLAGAPTTNQTSQFDGACIELNQAGGVGYTHVALVVFDVGAE